MPHGSGLRVQIRRVKSFDRCVCSLAYNPYNYLHFHSMSSLTFPVYIFFTFLVYKYHHGTKLYWKISRICFLLRVHSTSNNASDSKRVIFFPVYRTAGSIGGQLNLAVWRLGKRPSKLNPSNLSAIYACACAHIICTKLPPNLNPPIFLFRPLRTKPPNLKIANISGYTVAW